MAVDDAYSVLLMHMNGEDGSSTFTDEAGHTVTPYGAVIDTDQYKFGGASGLFDGSNDYAVISDSNDFDFGTGDFTIDFWVRFSALDGNSREIMQRLDAENEGGLNRMDLIMASNTLQFTAYTDGTQIVSVSRSITISAGNWYHVAIVGISGKFRLFLDGVQQGAEVDRANPGDMPYSGNIYLGKNQQFGIYWLAGWLDELRISKGIARWSENFTPPTAPYMAPVSFTPPSLEATAGLSAIPAESTVVVAEPLDMVAGLSATPAPSGQITVPPLAAVAGVSTDAMLYAAPAALSAVAGLGLDDVAHFIDNNYRITYVCTLGDLTIPITSFQARFKSGDPSFLSVVVPGLEYTDEIVARTGDLLRVYMVKTYRDGNVTKEMLGEVTQDALRMDEGARNQSITIDGHGTYTHSPKSVTLKNPQYKAVYGGTTRYRCSPDFHVRPGDTASIGDDTLLISAITWAVAVGSELMEVASEE